MNDLNLPARQPLRVLPWWVVLIGMAAVAVAIFVTLRWLLPIAGKSPALRIDAIKTGLSVGAGAGGATALLLALRRQWLYERTQAHAEEVARATQMHAQGVAQQDNFDATERRVTDLYCRAVEQIGHANAAVRLGGLYSLERLAEAHPEHRQTVADVICAYLRMPFKFPVVMDQLARSSTYTLAMEANEQQAQSKSSQELQVRLAAQRMLTRHLTNRTPIEGSTAGQRFTMGFWGQVRVDLNGAALYGFDFSECELGDADFRNAKFFLPTQFQRARFSGRAQFSNATFDRGISFNNSRFDQDVWFADSIFEGNAKFIDVSFGGETRFDDTTFHGEAHFTGATFSDIARFDDAEFQRNSWFDAASFYASAWFGGTHFTHGCAFEDTEFTYRNCRSSWPAGWHLQPVTDTIGKLKRSEQVFFGIARHPDPDAARIRASDRGRKLPT